MVEWVKPSLYFYSNEQVRIPVKSKNILEKNILKKLRHSRKEHSRMPRNHQFHEITSLKKRTFWNAAEAPVPRNYVTQETEDQVRIPVKSEKIQNSRFESQ